MDREKGAAPDNFLSDFRKIEFNIGTTREKQSNTVIPAVKRMLRHERSKAGTQIVKPPL